MLQKVCSKCKETKELTEFGKRLSSKDGLRGVCKICRNAHSRLTRDPESEALRGKKYRTDNAEAEKARCKKYRDANAEVIKQKSRDKYHKNAESESKRKAAYYQGNKEAVRIRTEKWRKSNMSIKRSHGANYRAAQLQRTVSWSNPEAIKAIYAEAAQLTIDTGIVHHVDHRIPLQGKTVSGFHHEDNLQILTASENCSKSNKF